MEMRRAHHAAIAALILAIVFAAAALAHPGSAIGVTADGRVYFVDTGGGVFSIVRKGEVARHDGPAFHWFAIDSASQFRRTAWPSIPGGELRAVGVDPTVILSSDVPVAIADGVFHFPERRSDGRVRIVAVAPSGKKSVRALLPPIRSRGDLAGWVNGLGAGPNGSLYYTEDRAVRIIDARGGVTTLADVGRIPRCAAIPGIGPEFGPYLRGIAVAADGTAYVAASGCGALLKITPRGAVTPILRAASPWAPTAVALAGDEIFVLEYTHTPSDDRREWLPRVRRISRDGSVETLVNTAPR